MAKTTEKLIPALWPLPGGKGRYLNTLDQILRWVAASPSPPNRQQFQGWMGERYSASKSASSYLSVVVRLRALKSGKGGKLELTSWGQSLVEAEGQAKSDLVIERFFTGYLAFPEVLAVYASSEKPVHIKGLRRRLVRAFPQWTSESQFEYRALWLLSLGCLRQARGRSYEITELGREVAARFTPVEDFEPPPDPAASPAPVAPLDGAEVSVLIRELESAATDSSSPERFERAVARSFEFLGFEADQLGGSGDTDVLVTADVGPGSYRAVVDTKARGSGKLAGIEPATLKDHRDNHDAQFALVVAKSFATGKVVRHAENEGVVLLPVGTLAKWLQQHNIVPLNLLVYKAVFTRPGLVKRLPSPVESAADQRSQFGRLLVDLIELIQETHNYGLTEALPVKQLFTMLVTRLRGVVYGKQQVEQAIAFLSNPIIGATTGKDAEGVTLALNRATLSRLLRALADQIEAAEAETQE